MRRFPNGRFSNNLSAEDRRTYRRWFGGMFLFYSAAIIVALGITFMNRPATDLRATNEAQTARLNVTTGSIFSTAKPITKP